MTNATLNAALSWYNYGVTSIPCRPQSKIPTIAWGRWQERRPPRRLIEHWFRRECNLALLTGDPLLVLDFDSLPVYFRWRLDNPDLARTYTVTTPRPGRHVYFRVDKPMSSMHLIDIDVRGTRTLIMAPPSIHPSGRPYIADERPILGVNGLVEALPSFEDSVMGKKKGHAGLSQFTDETDGELATLSFPVTESLSQRHDLVGRIRTALPILTLLSRWSTPIPSSRDGRWFVMRCPHPSHPDRNPSFWADARRGICSCFKPSCTATQPNAKPMDIFNLWSWLYNCSNRKAIHELRKQV